MIIQSQPRLQSHLHCLHAKHSYPGGVLAVLNWNLLHKFLLLFGDPRFHGSHGEGWLTSSVRCKGWWWSKHRCSNRFRCAIRLRNSPVWYSFALNWLNGPDKWVNGWLRHVLIVRKEEGKEGEQDLNTLGQWWNDAVVPKLKKPLSIAWLPRSTISPLNKYLNRVPHLAGHGDVVEKSHCRTCLFWALGGPRWYRMWSTFMFIDNTFSSPGWKVTAFAHVSQLPMGIAHNHQSGMASCSKWQNARSM